jgi:hypothetical protein
MQLYCALKNGLVSEIQVYFGNCQNSTRVTIINHSQINKLIKEPGGLRRKNLIDIVPKNITQKGSGATLPKGKHILLQQILHDNCPVTV